MMFAVLRASRHYPATVLAATFLLLLADWTALHFDVLQGLPPLAVLGALMLNAVAAPIWWTRWLTPSVGTGHWIGRRD